jgi:flagellar protein FliS
MAENNNFQKYQEQYVNTLTPGELVTLLYNEIIKRINKSIQNINDKKVCDAHNNIVKAQDILLHLISTLDFSYPISSELQLLYEYMYDRLIVSVKPSTH